MKLIFAFVFGQIIYQIIKFAFPIFIRMAGIRFSIDGRWLHITLRRRGCNMKTFEIKLY